MKHDDQTLFVAIPRCAVRKACSTTYSRSTLRGMTVCPPTAKPLSRCLANSVAAAQTQMWYSSLDYHPNYPHCYLKCGTVCLDYHSKYCTIYPRCQPKCGAVCLDCKPLVSNRMWHMKRALIVDFLFGAWSSFMHTQLCQKDYPFEYMIWDHPSFEYMFWE